MNNTYEQEIRYRLLKILRVAPDLTQREMAKKMGISLGKVNYCLAGLAKKGLIKINRFKISHNKFQYFYNLTPRGIEAKAELTLSFLKQKMTEYEEIRQQIKDLSKEAADEGLLEDSLDDSRVML